MTLNKPGRQQRLLVMLGIENRNTEHIRYRCTAVFRHLVSGRKFLHSHKYVLFRSSHSA